MTKFMKLTATAVSLLLVLPAAVSRPEQDRIAAEILGAHRLLIEEVLRG